MGQMPQTNDEVLNYVAEADPEKLPTKVLIRLAEQMKERRL